MYIHIRRGICAPTCRLYIYTCIYVYMYTRCVYIICRSMPKQKIQYDCHICSHMSMTTLREFHHPIATIAQVENFTSSALLSLQARCLAIWPILVKRIWSRGRYFNIIKYMNSDNIDKLHSGNTCRVVGIYVTHEMCIIHVDHPSRSNPSRNCHLWNEHVVSQLT